jgi:hypothetical protein
MFCIYAFVNRVAVMTKRVILTDMPCHKFVDIFNVVIGTKLGLNFTDKDVEYGFNWRSGMDNKYALGSTKVATEHHETVHKLAVPRVCKFCESANLVLCPTMHDHQCSACGEWQQDVEKSYATGRSSEY